MQWEYKIIDSCDLPGSGPLGDKRERPALEAYLNALGEESWEIIAFDAQEMMSSPNFVALARRQKA
jgi:hypothetical protein